MPASIGGVSSEDRRGDAREISLSMCRPVPSQELGLVSYRYHGDCPHSKGQMENAIHGERLTRNQ